MRHTRDALWFLFSVVVGLAIAAVSVLGFPVALASGIWLDIREALEVR